MNLSPCSSIDAVPSLKYLPPEVTGRAELAGRFPESAPCKAPLLPDTGLFVPGLAYPDMGLPVPDMGLIAGDIPVEFCAPVNGFSNEVPGLAAFDTAFSSIIVYK